MTRLFLIPALIALSACADDGPAESILMLVDRDQLPDMDHCIDLPRDTNVVQHMADVHGYSPNALWRTTDNGAVWVACYMGEGVQHG